MSMDRLASDSRTGSRPFQIAQSLTACCVAGWQQQKRYHIHPPTLQALWDVFLILRRARSDQELGESRVEARSRRTTHRSWTTLRAVDRRHSHPSRNTKGRWEHLDQPSPDVHPRTGIFAQNCRTGVCNPGAPKSSRHRLDLPPFPRVPSP